MFSACGSLGIAWNLFNYGVYKMSDEIKNVPSRRSAIKTAAQVAVTAPAVGLLLSAGTKAAQAYVRIVSGDNGFGVTTADDLADAGNGGTDNAVLIGDDLHTI
jgi:hypothetical protein